VSVFFIFAGQYEKTIYGAVLKSGPDRRNKAGLVFDWKKNRDIVC